MSEHIYSPYISQILQNIILINNINTRKFIVQSLDKYIIYSIANNVIS